MKHYACKERNNYGGGDRAKANLLQVSLDLRCFIGTMMMFYN